MNLFRATNIPLVDKSSFRKHFVRVLLFQAIIFLVCYLMVHFNVFHNTQFDGMYVYLLLTIINVILIFKVYRFDIFLGRFKDIYPEYDFHLFFLVLIILNPVLFFSFSILLYFKDGCESGGLPEFFRFRYVLSIFALVIAMQRISPPCGYWIASPSLYNLTIVRKDCFEMLDYKKGLSNSKDVIENYVKSHSKNLSFAEAKLLMAVNDVEITKDVNRAIANSANENEIKIIYGLEALTSRQKVLKILEKKHFDVFAYNPTSWFHITGPLEIFILGINENRNYSEAIRQLNVASFLIIDFLEQRISSLPVSKRKFYSNRLNGLRSKFQNNPSHRLVVSNK